MKSDKERTRTMSEIKAIIQSAIKARNDARSRRVSVLKLLQSNNMESYFHVCCSHIINGADFADLAAEGIEVVMPAGLDQYDINLTSDGMGKSRDILLGYIPGEKLADTFVMLCQEEAVTNEINAMAKELRNMSLIELINGFLKMSIRDRKKYQNENGEELKQCYILEFLCRSYLWKCKKKVCEVSRDVYLRFKLRRVIKELMAETEV